MEARLLYAKLEKDFITKQMNDDWAQYMKEVADYLTENFKQRSMGLVCDFTTEINKVYTAVFPEEKVMEKILKEGKENAMLFVHHPEIWDIRKAPNVFQNIDKKYLEEFKKRKISIYNLHVPLDNYGKYSTSTTLAKKLGIEYEKSFAHYFGAMAGIIGNSPITSVEGLRIKLQQEIGHKASLYPYGKDEILNGKVAIVAGGGNELDVIKEIAQEGINTFITGITIKNAHSQKEHHFLEENKINMIGGTHYSTEKFACQEMVTYFQMLGLESEFIEGKAILEDL